MIITTEMAKSTAVDQKDCWETPDHIYQKLHEKYKFNLDPCCTDETHKCVSWFTPEVDGLSRSWSGYRPFVNPPYSRGNIDKWVRKCKEEARFNCIQVIALLPVSTSADWFHRYVVGNTIHWVNKRIRFKGAPYTAPFSSMIVDFNGISANHTFNQ